MVCIALMFLVNRYKSGELEDAPCPLYIGLGYDYIEET